MSSRVHVGLSERAYDIFIGRSPQDHLQDGLDACGATTHVVVITDSHVDPLFGDDFVSQLESLVDRVDRIVVAPGEKTKSLGQFESLCEQVLECGSDRRTVVAALGGGVVGDLAGYVAASFARGVRFLQAPTTLLAQVDSSVGGKVGVNLPGAKNMVGAFWQPAAVVIGVDVLSKLPDRDYRAGLAEVVKYGVILDEPFFAYLEDHVDAIHARDLDVLEHIVTRCCRLKADVVENDEREETGLRAVLNYGHTFCHAIEAETNYGEYLHGEAVAIGMLCASRLAERLGRVSSELTERQHALLTALRLPTEIGDLDIETLTEAMKRDKKVAHGQLRFILPSRMGHVELVGDVPHADVLASWRA